MSPAGRQADRFPRRRRRRHRHPHHRFLPPWKAVLPSFQRLAVVWPFQQPSILYTEWSGFPFRISFVPPYYNETLLASSLRVDPE